MFFCVIFVCMKRPCCIVCLKNMSHFSVKIEELLNRKKMKAIDLVRLSGVSQPLMSKWLRNDQTYVSLEDLAKLCSAISQDPLEQAELIAAHLEDRKQGPGAENVIITING